MMKRYFKYAGMSVIVFLIFTQNFKAQITPEQAGFIDVTKYGATPGDSSDCDAAAIQEAIDDAVEAKKGIFLPAGDYHIEKGLVIDDPGKRDDARTISGTSVDSDRRSRVILKEGSAAFQDESSPVAVFHSIAYNGFANTFMRQLKHIDIIIRSNNPAAVGVSWQGAEGIGVYDVHVDLTRGGMKGFWGLPGSGGSTHDISVRGGKIAVDLRGYFPGTKAEGAQPSPMISGGLFKDQTECAIIGHYRGTLVLVGCEFVMKPEVPVQKEIEACWLSTGALGGLPVYVDCKIEYREKNINNTLFTFAENPNGFAFDHVYIKNAEHFLEASDIPESDEWLFYPALAYDPPLNHLCDGVPVHQGIYMNGKRISEDKLWSPSHQEVAKVPSDLRTRHMLPLPFPSFESKGAVSIIEYEKFKTPEGDWSQAFHEAIHTDQVKVLCIPPGDYKVRNTIHLKSDSRIVGMNARITNIYGTSEGEVYFDDATDPYNDPRPVMQTPDDADAEVILTDIGVKVAYPHDGIDYNPHPVGLYSLLWQVGGESLVKNLDTDKYPIGKFRHHKALDTLGNMPLQLTEVDSGYIESGFEFSSDCASNYFGHQFIPSKILVEYHKNGGGRLVTRSMDPRHNSAKFFNTPNLTIRSAGRTHFDLYSLRISPASGNPYNCPDVKIVKIRNDRRIDSIVIPFGCGMSSRQTLKEIDLNWKGISSVELSSAKAFSVDEVNGSPGIAKFENIDHVRLTYDTWDVASVFQHLPIGPVVHPNVLITNNGGGRWYNYWKHGNQWMNFNAPYIQIEGNEQPVSFYHLHVQHSQNDVKVRLKNARSVRIFGVKVENPRTVLRAYNSNDIHVYGHGGMTNPIPGHNQYYFENCQNYKVVSLAEQLYEYNSPGKNYWNYLVKTDYSEALYKSLKDVRVQDVYTNDDFYRPLWWEFATDRESEQMP